MGATMPDSLSVNYYLSYVLGWGIRWRYKPEGRGFDSRWCLWNFSLT